MALLMQSLYFDLTCSEKWAQLEWTCQIHDSSYKTMITP